MRAVLGDSVAGHKCRRRNVGSAGGYPLTQSQQRKFSVSGSMAQPLRLLFDPLRRLIELILPKRVCHTQQRCNARGDKRTGPKQASHTSPPTKNRCEKRAIS